MTTTDTPPKRKQMQIPPHPAMAALKHEQQVLRKILRDIDGVPPTIARAALARAMATLIEQKVDESTST